MSDWTATLYGSVTRGCIPLQSITDQIKKTWRRSIRAVGGYWLGTCDYEGTRDELLEMYLDSLGREVREESGGAITWRGYIAEMELSLDGVTWSRSLLECANAVKCVYTRLFDNLLTNGGAESGAWAAVNGATTAQITTWVNSGMYSCQVTVADTVKRGARIGTVTISAEIEYVITGVLRIVSGAWRVIVFTSDGVTQLVAGTKHEEVGDVNIDIRIPASNTYAGTVYLDLLSCNSIPGVANGDSFNFCRAPVSDTQTGWYTEPNSISQFGRLELADRLVGMTDGAANSKAQTTLRKSAWPNTKRPQDLTSFDTDLLGKQDKLSLTVHGYVHTLANRYCLTPGLAANSSDLVTTIINESEFIEVGSIAVNSNPFMVDARAPVRHWQALSDIIAAGDGSNTGQRWVGGVYGDLSFDYGPALNTVAYTFQGGTYYNVAGGELEPWLALPGQMLYMSDMPVWPGNLSDNLEDDPHLAFITEVTMGPPTEAQPRGTITMREVE